MSLLRFPLWIAAALLASCGGDPVVGSAAADGRPNVVVVVMDTTRVDRCSLYGYAKQTTPVMSALAAEGICYFNAWTPSPWTGPAHASIFTGLRPENHGFLWGRLRPYLVDRPTLAGWFREAGYRTACFSNNAFVSREYGLEQGFEYASREFESPDRPYPTAPATHRAAMEWVRRAVADDRNFFLFVNDMEPHCPYFPTAEFEEAFVPPTVSLDLRKHCREIEPMDLLDHLIRRKPLAPSVIQVLSSLYDAEIALLDREVGVLLDGIRRLGILDDTVFVLLGDHGENFGEHGMVDHLGSLHRSLLHVPLVIRYPSRFAPGTVREELVRLEDLPPTLLDLCDLPIPEGLDGESLLGPLGNRIARASYLPVGHHQELIQKAATRNTEAARLNREIRAVHDGRWHYIAFSDGMQELYDLANDPRETKNLAWTLPEEVLRLSGLLPVLPGTGPAPGALPPR